MCCLILQLFQEVITTTGDVLRNNLTGENTPTPPEQQKDTIPTGIQYLTTGEWPNILEKDPDKSIMCKVDRVFTATDGMVLVFLKFDGFTTE